MESMESIIESLEWTAEDELEPLAINQTKLSYWIALPNGQFKESWLIAALAAPKEQSSNCFSFVKKRNAAVPAEGERTMKSFLLFLDWWVKGGSCRTAPPRRENKEEMIDWVSEPPNKESEMNEAKAKAKQKKR